MYPPTQGHPRREGHDPPPRRDDQQHASLRGAKLHAASDEGAVYTDADTTHLERTDPDLLRAERFSPRG
jgi:hypothetical protein